MMTANDTDYMPLGLMLAEKRSKKLAKILGTDQLVLPPKSAPPSPSHARKKENRLSASVTNTPLANSPLMRSKQFSDSDFSAISLLRDTGAEEINFKASKILGQPEQQSPLTKSLMSRVRRTDQQHQTRARSSSFLRDRSEMMDGAADLSMAIKNFNLQHSPRNSISPIGTPTNRLSKVSWMHHVIDICRRRAFHIHSVYNNI